MARKNVMGNDERECDGICSRSGDGECCESEDFGCGLTGHGYGVLEYL